MRTEKDGIDFTTLGTHRFEHFGLDAPKHVHVEQPAGDTRLVAGDDDLVAVAMQTGDGLQTSGNGDPLLGRLDVFVRVFVDDAVAIEDDEFHMSF